MYFKTNLKSNVDDVRAQLSGVAIHKSLQRFCGHTIANAKGPFQGNQIINAKVIEMLLECIDVLANKVIALKSAFEVTQPRFWDLAPIFG